MAGQTDRPDWQCRVAKQRQSTVAMQVGRADGQATAAGQNDRAKWQGRVAIQRGKAEWQGRVAEQNDGPGKVVRLRGFKNVGRFQKCWWPSYGGSLGGFKKVVGGFKKVRGRFQKGCGRFQKGLWEVSKRFVRFQKGL